jgi:citrate lyase gamma subunit
VYARIFVVLALAGTLSHCDTDILVCSAELVAIHITIVNQVGQPLDGLQVADTVRRTGKVLDLSPAASPVIVPAEGGAAAVFSDDFLHEVRSGGDEVIVVVTAGGHSSSGVFRFGSNGCHVEKIAGPDSLIIS